MRACPVIGGIIIAVLLVSIVYASVSPLIPQPVIPTPEEEKPKVITEYTLTSVDLPAVDKVELNLRIKAGGININFTGNSNLIYELVFKQDEDTPLPSVSYTESDGKLFVNISAESGDLKATFGNNYIYNGMIELGVGGMSATLSEYANIDMLDLTVKYAGGVSVEVLNGSSFSQLNLKVNTGGIMLKVDANTLGKSGSISGEVRVGGIIVQPISTGANVGLKLNALADIGGITLNPAGFDVIKQTVTECEIKTSNYAEAPIKLEVNISTGLGGTMINQPFFGFPRGFPT